VSSDVIDHSRQYHHSIERVQLLIHHCVPFSRYCKLFVKSLKFFLPTCNWRLCWGEPTEIISSSLATEN